MCDEMDDEMIVDKLKLGERLRILRYEAIERGCVKLLTTDEILTLINSNRGIKSS